MGLKNRKIRLRTFFIRYLLALFVGFVIIITLGFSVGFLSLATGFTISVGQVEEQIEKNKAQIANSATLNASLIPTTCKYALMSENGEFISGNMTKEAAKGAFRTVKSGKTTSGSLISVGLNVSCYLPIKRSDGICIVEYSSLSQFSSQFLREHLPKPEVLNLWFIIIATILEIVFLSRLYGKKISARLIPLHKTTEKIRNKDLEFNIETSGIEEIDAALASLDSMKTDLRNSLEKQWKMEQTKKTQISALAHDLKTPLTVVKGNAELLCDTDLSEEQKEETGFILKNADKMAQYVQMLIDISKAESGYTLNRVNINTKDFVEDIKTQIAAIASVKQLKTEFFEENLPEKINVDAALLQRAIINVVSNGADYSPKEGTLSFCVSGYGEKVKFIITDSGKGFSPEDIKNATTQFYQGDSSRSSKLHYGMGLFIADTIVKKHNGTLTIANSPKTGGGMVTIEI